MDLAERLMETDGGLPNGLIVAKDGSLLLVDIELHRDQRQQRHSSAGPAESTEVRAWIPGDLTEYGTMVKKTVARNQDRDKLL